MARLPGLQQLTIMQRHPRMTEEDQAQIISHLPLDHQAFRVIRLSSCQHDQHDCMCPDGTWLKKAGQFTRLTRMESELLRKPIPEEWPMNGVIRSAEWDGFEVSEDGGSVALNQQPEIPSVSSAYDRILSHFHRDRLLDILPDPVIGGFIAVLLIMAILLP